MQLILGIGFASVAFLLPTSIYFQTTLAIFWFMAFSSATHDIAADGFYMMGLNDGEQSYFIGIRNTFYRCATAFGEGVLLIAAGYFEIHTKSISLSWSIVFFILSAIFLGTFLYHRIILPKPNSDIANTSKSAKDIFREFINTFETFFEKKEIVVTVAFILLYRLGEAFLVKITPLFLKDLREVGGLGFSKTEIGEFRIWGIVALTIGGILGGIAVSRKGLKFWLWIMALCITLPHLAFVYLSYFQPTNYLLIGSAIAFEQFGYGFSLTSFFLYMIYFSEGEYKTAHYAICTGFMAAGMFLPGMLTGKLQELWGYYHFFLFVMLCAIPTLAVIPFLKIDKNFGKER